MAVNRMTEKVCGCCQRPRGKEYFNKSPNPAHSDGLLPYCKACATARYKVFLNATGNEDAALWLLLSEFGIPAFREVFEVAHKMRDESGGAGRKPDMFKAYVGALETSGIKYTGFWDSDVMLNRFYDVGKVDEEVEVDLPKDNYERLKALAKTWGKFETPDGALDEAAYDMLEESFEAYTSELEAMDTNLENRYKDLCRAELALRRANESGDFGNIKSAQDVLNKQLALLKLNEFDTAEKSDTDRFIDRLIWKIEETEPCEEEDRERFKDLHGFEKAFENIMRSMKSLLTGNREYPDIPKDEQ